MATEISKKQLAAPTLMGRGMALKCWNNYWKEYMKCLYTPFVVSLAAGNLELDTFRNYIAQDVYFLKAFAQAYESAEDYADDDDAKIMISDMRASVLEELKMHESFGQEWGFDLAKETPNPTTVKYTEFLLATVSGKVEGVISPDKLATPFEKTNVAAYTLASMTPCMRLYAFLGKQLLAFLDNGESSHPYKKWIHNYASADFQASAAQVEDLLEKLSVSLTGEELDIIEKLYHQAMKLELDFFLAQPLVQKTVVPLSEELRDTKDHLVIFSDFDLTCTVQNSFAILAEMTITSAPKPEQSQPEKQIARMSSADLRNSWGVFATQYTTEHYQCIEEIFPNKFDYEGLCKALVRLSAFEKKANERVSESGLLKGLNLDDIKQAGKHLILKEGCTSFFQSIIKNENLGANIHILSYCWCADLIRSAFSSGGLDVLNIHANEFNYESSLSTGEIVMMVETPSDQIQAFRNILKGFGNNRKLTVYIGESVGDLLCLLEADVGIVFDSSSSLRSVGTHFGVSFVPLFPGIVEKQKRSMENNSSTWKGLSGILYTVSSWAEIHAFILGS